MHVKASYRNYDKMRQMYGQVPGGMFGGDENCRPGYVGPRQAVETCGMVEMMLSTETLTWITGDLQKTKKVSRVEVYWFDDAGRGGCRTPAS